MPEAPLTDSSDEAAESLMPWTAAMDAATDEEGYFHNLGARHWAFFFDQGTKLIVSFETADAIRRRPGNMPMLQSLAARHGWSHLCLIADGATWFRDPAVYAFFDRQVDDAFFEDFDQVLFFGAGMAGYAACAYSVAAPGAQVLALNPCATQDPRQTGWDRRDLDARRLDFTSRYGYAPDMLEGVAQAVVVHDPTIATDAMHAALFRAPYILRLAARHLGDEAMLHLGQMAILTDMIEAAMAGKLDDSVFARLWRARRNHPAYLDALIAKASAAGRIRHEIMLCRFGSQYLQVPPYAERLARLTGFPDAAAAPAQDPAEQSA